MPEDSRGMGCKAQVGMLILRDCNGTATGQCSQCSRPVCRDHQVGTVEGTITCPECSGIAAQEMDIADEGRLPRPVRRARRRRRYYNNYGYHSPYFHGRHHHYHSDHLYYSDRDRAALDRREETGQGGAASAADTFDDHDVTDGGGVHDYAES